MARMLGRTDKPPCGNCCSQYRPGTGHANKQTPKQRMRRTERTAWVTEYVADIEYDIIETEAVTGLRDLTHDLKDT